ncbi:MAG: hypothetical protein FWG27_03245 [Treponema sp.]|nr:hypothetical protein [Treponema sp.]
MSNLDFIKKDKIDSLLNAGGYVLDFTNRSFQEFVYEKIQIDIYEKYPSLSKGKILRAILNDYDDRIAGKLLLELLRYMREKELIADEDKEKFKQCAEIGNHLIGKTTNVKAASDKNTAPPSPITSVIDYEKYMKELLELGNMSDNPQARGFAFEKYLKSLFDAFSLQPRCSFKLMGEQIDGSFILRDEVYLIEAKWTSSYIDKGQLSLYAGLPRLAKRISGKGYRRSHFT